MRYAWIILTMICLLAVLSACQQAEVQTQDLQDTAAQMGSPTLESSATQPTPLLSTPEGSNMTPVTPPDEASGKMASLVQGHLAQRLKIAVDQIVVSDIKPVMWRDASLGCPKPGIDYIQMETPGYNISLTADGKTYTYHTDATKRFVQCNK